MGDAKGVNNAKQTDAKSFFERTFDNYVQKGLKSPAKVLVMGVSGVGKSTLVNHFFGPGLADKAAISHSSPCTKAFESYGPIQGKPVIVYDSKGLERDIAAKQVQEFLQWLKKRPEEEKKKASKKKEQISEEKKEKIVEKMGEKSEKKHNIKKHNIDVVWYFVNRLEEQDKVIVEQLREEKYPIIFIIPKSDSINSEEMKERKADIRKKFGSDSLIVAVTNRGIGTPKNCPRSGCNSSDFFTNSKDRTFFCAKCSYTGTWNYKFKGLKKLENLTYGFFVKGGSGHIRRAFVAAQEINYARKLEIAECWVVLFTALAYLLGWCPIPCADLPFLLLMEVLLATKIAFVYGLFRKEDVFTALKTVGVGGAGSTVIGLSLATLFKLIPGVGTIVGGFIDSTVAGSVMVILGQSLICHWHLKKTGQTATLTAISVVKTQATEKAKDKEFQKKMLNIVKKYGQGLEDVDLGDQETQNLS